MARINGQLTLINDPSDARQTGAPWGTLRSTGNAILLVMKDPKLAIEDPVGNTITLKKTGQVVDGTLQNVKIKVDSKEYPMEGDSVTVTGLKPNMEYVVSYSYEIVNSDGSVEKGSSHTYKLTTEDYEFPELKIFEEDKKENGTLTLKYRINDDSGVVSKVYVKNGDVETIAEGLSGKVVIENIDTKIENSFTLVVELTNGETLELSTLNYAANSIPAKEVASDPSGDNPTDVEPKPGKSGCKKDAALLVVSLIGLSSMFVIFRRKR